jgi:MFS superfamily sulfate permease-like transporter
MKKETFFLKAVVILIGLIILVPSIFWLPSFIGYLPYIVIVGVYITAIVFFFALYQTLKLLGYIENNKTFTKLAIKSLNYIKYCAFTISIIYVILLPLLYPIAESDDAPGIIGFPIIISLFHQWL